MKSLRSNFLFFAFLLFSFSAQASWWQAIKKNNEGVEQMNEEFHSEAHDLFVQALSEDPFLAAVHVNLGLTFEKNEEDKKALSEYLLAAKLAKEDEIRYYGLFNAARMLGKSKQYAPALSLYQQALDLQPTSLAVKTNIELLMQQQQQQQQQKQQQGKGQGKGGGKNDKEKKKEDEEEKKDGPVVNRRKQKPRPFQSKKLSKKDVEKILEELKNQEQKVRREQNQKSSKEKAREKDW